MNLNSFILVGRFSGILRVKAIKTAESRRRIDLSPDTFAVLAKQRKAALAAGRIASPVFHDTEGGYLQLSNLVKNPSKPILKWAGLPSVGLNSLRHTCATLLLLAHQLAKVVSERLGHSSVTLTLDTYSHVQPTKQKRAADVLGAILGQPRGVRHARRENGGMVAIGYS